MVFVIIDSNEDIKYRRKKYPYPMELIKETEEKLVVDNQGVKEIIDKGENIKINKISIKKKDYNKIK